MGGWKSIRHLLLFFLFFFFSHSASLFPACLSSSGCARVYTTYVAGGGKEKTTARQIKLTPAHEAIFLHRPTRPNSFVRSHVVFLFWRVFVFFGLFGCFFFCLLPVSPPPLTAASPRPVDRKTPRHPGHVKTRTRGTGDENGGQTPLPISGGAGAGSHHKG